MDYSLPSLDWQVGRSKMCRVPSRVLAVYLTSAYLATSANLPLRKINKLPARNTHPPFESLSLFCPATVLDWRRPHWYCATRAVEARSVHIGPCALRLNRPDCRDFDGYKSDGHSCI